MAEVEPGSTNEPVPPSLPTGCSEPVARPDTQWTLGSHRNMGGVRSKHRVPVSNCEYSWEAQRDRSRIKEQFPVINNCKPWLLVQKRTNSPLLIKNKQPHLGPSSGPWEQTTGLLQPVLQKPMAWP